jgi:tRNA nucleotidyltransferase (CCA-adding enzyme)
LQKAGHDTYVVGGAVRDMIMNRDPKDFDIVTTAKPNEIITLFSEQISSSIGAAFGIVIVNINNELHEIATMRLDGDYSDGRRPDDVILVRDIEKDLSRRDFTINAIAYDPIKGILRDPFAGAIDIYDKKIDTCGDPYERFSEDRLRILRAYRFMAQFNFTFESRVNNAIKTMIDFHKDGILFGVSQERITAEFTKILLAPNCVDVITKMAKDGILQIIIPEIQEVINCEHESPWHNETWDGFGNTVFAHILHVMNEIRKTEKFENATEQEKTILMLSAMFHDIGKPRCKKYKTI